MTNIDKSYLRTDTPTVGTPPFGQVHAHSTGNRASTAENEASFMKRKDLNTGFYTHVVGNGKIYQTSATNRGAWDVGGGWNDWGYASVELIESHKSQAEFMRDYAIYVNLLRELAREAGVPLKVDTGNTGVITHAYATAHQPYNNSDHIDPYPYLAKWGITKERFAKDVVNGLNVAQAPSPAWKENKNNHGIIRVNYSGKGGVRLTKKDGSYTDKYVKNNTAWKIVGIDKAGFQIGKDEYLPFKFAKVLVGFTTGYGVLAYDKDAKQIKGTNKKFVDNTSWKAVGGYKKDDYFYIQVSKTEFIKGIYTK